VKNAQQQSEDCNFFSMAAMGARWNNDLVMWPVGVQNINALNSNAVIQHCPRATLSEQAYFQEDETSFHWNNARVHRQMQVTLRRAVLSAVSGHPFHAGLAIFDQTIDTMDLYQGSRLLAHLVETMDDFLATKRPQILTATLQIAIDIKANVEIEAQELHTSIQRLGNHIDLLVLSNYPAAEVEVITHFCNNLQTSRVPALANIARDVLHAGVLTITALRTAVLRAFPVDLAVLDGSINVAQVSNAPSVAVNSRVFTPEQQQAHIVKLKDTVKNQATEIKELKAELARVTVKTRRNHQSPTSASPQAARQGGSYRRRSSGSTRGEAHLGQGDGTDIFFAGVPEPDSPAP